MNSQLFPSVLVSLCLLPLPVRAAQVLVSGNSMDSSNSGFTTALNTLGNTYTFVPPSGFLGTSLGGFTVVWLDGFSLYNSGLNTKLTDFLNAGGTVLVQSPGFGSESISEYPLGATLSAVYSYPPGENLIRLAAPGNPLNAGLTEAGLSNWNPSAGGYFTAAGDFTVVTDNGAIDQLITLERNVGAGTLVYTQQGISQRLSGVSDPAALRLLHNVIQTAVPEPGMIGLFVLGAGMLTTGLRAKRLGK